MQKVLIGYLAFVGSSLYSYKAGIQNIPLRLQHKWADSSVAFLTDDVTSDFSRSSSENYLAQNGICCMAIFSPHTSDVITEEALSSIDTLIVDITDFGVCTSSSFQALLRALCVAASSNTKVVILDRPNPLGYRMEGPLVSCGSGLVPLSIPLRHGMTAGELAWFCNMHCLARPAMLYVVQIRDYNRENDCTTDTTVISSLFAFVNAVPSLSYQNGMLLMPLCGTQADWDIFSESMRSCGVTTSIDQSDNGVVCSITNKKPSDLSFCKAVRYIVDFLTAQSIECEFTPLYELCQGERSTYNLINFFGKARSSFMYTPLPLITECL